MQVFVGNLVHSLGPNRLEILIDHVIAINDSGTIEYLKPTEEFTPNTEDTITQLKPDQFLFPGFIDTHCHAPQYPNCGIFGNSTLLDWLEKYTFPLESKYSDTNIASQVFSPLIKRQLQNGTTTTSYFGTSNVQATVELAKICLERGQRAQVGRVCMERLCPEDLKDATIESDIDFINSVCALDPTKTKIWPVLTPRFAPSCTFDTLAELGDLAHARNLPVQTHINENISEIELVKRLFPEAAHYTDVYYRAKLLKHNTVLAHGIHFTPEELELVKKQKSGISHCPNSNASLASGIAQVKCYLNQGLKVSLGSDVSGGSTVSILKNARLALLMSRILSQQEHGSLEPVLTVSDALFLATLGGAQVLDRESSLGNFAVGKYFDAQLIDVCVQDSPIDLFELALPNDKTERIENYLNKWVFIGDDRNTIKVWVGGELVHSRFELK